MKKKWKKRLKVYNKMKKYILEMKVTITVLENYKNQTEKGFTTEMIKNDEFSSCIHEL